ncbi:MAG: glycoside hydrolase, partial [Bacteroidota bacterium]|nr:glycoside hydrolase [Bacteroidota bacterium]
MKYLLVNFLFSLLTCGAVAQPKKQEKTVVPDNPAPYVSKVWVADQGNGTYKNPILNADYSDPDAIRMGNDFY